VAGDKVAAPWGVSPAQHGARQRLARAGPDGHLGQARYGRHKLDRRVQARGTRALTSYDGLKGRPLSRYGGEGSRLLMEVWQKLRTGSNVG